MLVLSRKENERFTAYIPASDKPQVLRVMVVRIGTDQVRLGIEADRSIDILRDDAVCCRDQRTEAKA